VLSSQTAIHEDLRDAFLLCRTIGHGWDEVVRNDLEKPEYGWRFSLRCTRCLCERHDVIDPRNGDLVPNGRRYFHPDGYELDEKVTRSEFRQEWARRNHYFDKKSRKR
jgi:hypothetical protein